MPRALPRARGPRHLARQLGQRPAHHRVLQVDGAAVAGDASPEFRFLKAWLLEAHAQTRHLLPECQVAKASLGQLFDQFKAWLVQTSSTGRASYDITDSKFGMRLTDLIIREPSATDAPSASEAPRTTKAVAMRGISKKHGKTGNSYVFHLPIVLREMARVGWVNEQDLPTGLPVHPSPG